MRQARREAVCSGGVSAGHQTKPIEREFGAYDAIRDNFPKYVVSLDEFDMQPKRDQAPQHPRFPVGRGMELK